LVLVLGGSGTAFGELLLAEGSLLVLLAEGAEGAAAGKGKIGQAGSLELVLLAHLSALHPDGNEAEANAVSSDDQKALL
jgi:hypothetical protein